MNPHPASFAHRTSSPELREITVTAPARLHFGLLRFGQRQGRQFGGAGVMIDRPSLTVRVTPSRHLQVRGPHADRIHQVVHRWIAEANQGQSPQCNIEVVTPIPPHRGLGSGTQLALGVAAGLAAFHQRRWNDAEQLAAVAGRGRRSAVGTHGFCHGGFIAELGKRPDEILAPLYRAIAMPSSWRVVLFRSGKTLGLAGAAEQAAFRQLPPVPQDTSERLERLLCEEMTPALERSDFARFSHAVGTYGELAGSCFSACQGGPYAGAEITRLVQICRDAQYFGAGQSSWGPTAFVFAEDERQATQLKRTLAKSFPQAEIDISSLNHGGAVIS
ncbi:MAG: hypothetical protein AAGF97_13385 [Planctomycetota bacterium]